METQTSPKFVNLRLIDRVTRQPLPLYFDENSKTYIFGGEPEQKFVIGFKVNLNGYVGYSVEITIDGITLPGGQCFFSEMGYIESLPKNKNERRILQFSETKTGSGNENPRAGKIILKFYSILEKGSISQTEIKGVNHVELTKKDESEKKFFLKQGLSVTAQETIKNEYSLLDGVKNGSVFYTACINYDLRENLELRGCVLRKYSKEPKEKRIKTE